MKKLLYISLLFGFIISACHKEEITNIHDEITDPPIIKNGSVYLGKVQSEINVGLPNTLINIYQNGAKIGSVTTDEQGNYTTGDLEIFTDKDVIFEIEKDKFYRKVRKFTPKEGYQKGQDFILYQQHQNQFLDVPAFLLTDTNLVKVYGTLTDIDGNPIEGAMTIALWGFPDLISLNGAFDISDANGYFEFLVKKDKEIFLVSLLEGLSQDCQIFFNRNDSGTGAYPNVPNGFQHIGKLDSDMEFIEKDDLDIDVSTTILHGKLLNCDGTPVTSGNVEARITTTVTHGGSTITHTGIFLTDYFDNQGQFSLTVRTCGNGDEDIAIRGLTDDNYGVDLVFVYQGEETIDLGNLLTCQYYTPSSNYMSIAVGDVFTTDSIELVGATLGKGISVNGVFKEDSLWNIGNTFIINDELTVGSHDFFLFNFGGDKPWGFRAINKEIKAEITSVYSFGKCVDATFEGMVQTNSKGQQNVTGSFTYCKD